MNVTTSTRTRGAGPAGGSATPRLRRRQPGQNLRQPGQNLRQPAGATLQAAVLTRTAAGSRPGPPPTARPRATPAAAAASAGAAVAAPGTHRTPFIVLLLGLLGGGLVCLLVINTTLAAAAFQISDLQKSNVELAQRQQDLQQQVASAESPATIEQRAYYLGMRPQSMLNFVDLNSGRRYTSQAATAGAASVPGYGP